MTKIYLATSNTSNVDKTPNEVNLKIIFKFEPKILVCVTILAKGLPKLYNTIWSNWGRIKLHQQILTIILKVFT